MNLEWTDEQVSLRATTRRFLADGAPVTPYVRAMLDDPTGVTDQVWKGAAALGITGLLAPVDSGGAGLGMVDLAVVAEELGRNAHPGPLIASAVGAVRALARLGVADDPALRDLADGSKIGTLALVEPGYQRRWDLSETRAEQAADGHVLTGEKVDVLDAMAADLFLVVAIPVDDPDGGVELFAVERGAPGLTVSPRQSVDGTRKMGAVRLERTPARQLGNAGTRVIESVVDDLLVALGCDALGAADRCLELALEYAKVREQFGRPIGSFQAVQHLCVDMYRAVEMARGTMMYAAWAGDENDLAEYHRAAMMVKASARSLVGVAEAAIQVFGGIGFTWEHDVHLFYKRLLSFDAFLGSSGAYVSDAGRQFVHDVRRSRTR